MADNDKKGGNVFPIFNETALKIENQQQENKWRGIGDLCGNTYNVFEVLDSLEKKKDILEGIFAF